ncbi:FAD-dependent oxidoreductase [bacterium]|nr:FAD-dependent oxidoreductase [bacterium]
MSISAHRKRIAVIGSGIAGVSASYGLHEEHDVTLYESRERLGGHTHTIVVEDPQAGPTAVDTGFIVCNDRTYPHFHRFLQKLGVPVRNADMSFGFYDERRDFGYAPTSLLGVLPSLSHLTNRDYWSMWRTLPRFNASARRDLREGAVREMTLREYLEKRNIPDAFRDLFLVPMGAAIWSSGDNKLLDTPAETFLAFFQNHGLLSLFDRPQWQTVVGGSFQYLKAFSKQFRGEVRLGTPVQQIVRDADGVTIRSKTGSEDRYDLVVLACHADQVLPMLGEPNGEERELFGVWRYHKNRTVLHTDQQYLPPNKRIWASWNYRREEGEEGDEPLSITYHMNRLQGLRTAHEYCVTLNPRRDIPEQHCIRILDYAHPVFSQESVATQERIRKINGTSRTYYCGSYLGWGFHEDAIRSSTEVIEKVLGS